MSLFSRIQRGIKFGLDAARTAPDMKAVSKQLDLLITNGDLPTEEKAIQDTSKLDIRNTDHDFAYGAAFRSIRMALYRPDVKKIPEYGTLDRDVFLSEFWMKEPILAGAVYSMSAKMSALKWLVSGPRLKAINTARLLARAAFIGGFDWGGFIGSTANDFYTTNNGVYWETPKEGDARYGKLADVGHIDSLCCTMTGNTESPMVYVSENTGQTLRFQFGEFIHYASLPSPRERWLGLGYCAVDRSYRAAKLLLGLHDYDDEKLSNLPPEGIATVTGLTMEEFQDAIKLWQEGRKRDRSLTFPQVLWLIASQPGGEVKVDIQSFSTIPESFDRQTVVTHYISTLALDFGVDAREFWPISSGSLGTASESEIQHIKAKGKGPGEFISTTERKVNGELPEGVDFGFDTQDIEEDMTAATVAKAWVDVFYPLYQGTPAGRNKETQFPKPARAGNTESQQPAKAENPQGMPGNFGAPTVEQVIDKEQLIRLLADKGVLPDYMVNDERISIRDSDIHVENKGRDADNDDAVFVWEKGVLKEQRPNPIIINSIRQVKNQDENQDENQVVPAEILEKKEFTDVKAALDFLATIKEQAFTAARDIKGDPIPAAEVTRGIKITPKTIRDEMERWRNDPVLAKYALTTNEEQALIDSTLKGTQQ